MPDKTFGGDPTGSAGFISQIIDLISGLKGKDIDASQGFADVADPFRQHRGESQDMLFKLLKDPGSFSLDPGQNFALNTGLDSVNAKGNAMFGTTRAGNTAVELDKFGTGFANQAYNDRIKQLMDMSGVSSGSPAAAAQLLANGKNANNTSLASGLTGAGSILSMILGNKDIMGLFKGATGQLAQLFKGMFGDDLSLDQINAALAEAGYTGDTFNYPGGDGINAGNDLTNLFQPDPTDVPVDIPYG